MKYGVTIYEAVVDHKGKSYEIVVAEDGTLVEKVLVIDDEEVELATCPAAVQAAFREHAKGGTIGDITRSTGIGRPTYEAEVEIKGKVYLVEVDESGLLISKSLEAARRVTRRPGPQRIARAVFSSWIARWTCPRARAWPGCWYPWLLSCMSIPCKVRRAWLIRASDWAWVMRLAARRRPAPPPPCRIPMARPLFMPDAKPVPL